MTENEALKLVEKMVISRKCEIIKTLELKAVILNTLEEIQQYRAIGTIEEFKALKEKNEPKKAGFDNEDGWEAYICPNCGKTVGEHQKYCWNCGQSFET